MSTSARIWAATARRTASSASASNSSSPRRPARCACSACNSQRGRGQLPTDNVDNGGITGAGAGGGSWFGINGSTTSCTISIRALLCARLVFFAGMSVGVAGSADGFVNGRLLTRKLRLLPSWRRPTSRLPVSRHQAGRSSSTDASTEIISSSWPGSSGSMCLRLSRSRPLPRSRSPPSKLVAGRYGCADSMGMLRRGSVADTGRSARQELDQFRPADDRRSWHELGLVEFALLETR